MISITESQWLLHIHYYELRTMYFLTTQFRICRKLYSQHLATSNIRITRLTPMIAWPLDHRSGVQGFAGSTDEHSDWPTLHDHRGPSDARNHTFLGREILPKGRVLVWSGCDGMKNWNVGRELRFRGGYCRWWREGGIERRGL